MLNKLQTYGIRGTALDLITTYLNPQQQYISSGKLSSELRSVKTGVPQKSISGPLLFSLYINDLHCIVKCPEVNFICYADDITLNCRKKYKGY